MIMMNGSEVVTSPPDISDQFLPPSLLTWMGEKFAPPKVVAMISAGVGVGPAFKARLTPPPKPSPPKMRSKVPVPYADDVERMRVPLSWKPPMTKSCIDSGHSARGQTTL